MAMTDPAAGLRAQLDKLAIQFVLPGRLPDVDQAISLACELITRDLVTPATVDVAALGYGTALRDCGQLIRDMLGEQGVSLLDDDATEAGRLDFILGAFASGGLSVGDMSAALYRALPSWQDQSEVQCQLVRLYTELDQETSPRGKAAIVAAMRAVAAGRADAAALPFRLRVEVAFRMSGRGTVITGVIEQGILRVGDELELVQPANDERAESRLTRCIGMGDIRAADRPGEAIIGVVVSGLAPHDVRPGGVLQGCPGKAMTAETAGPPEFVVDGASFDDLAGFFTAITRTLGVCGWVRNLDALNDILRGGFGTPDGGFILRWANSALSAERLGWPETIRFLEKKLAVCHPANITSVQADLALARRGEGQTLFEIIVSIIQAHGPYGAEREDNVHLVLALAPLYRPGAGRAAAAGAQETRGA
jgi:hypothetical protein